MTSLWHSLSGYLWYKPGGVLGKILPKSRHWYVLDERNCRLLSFKSRDAAKQKQPDSHIDLNKAAITLTGGTENSFVILCDGREHIFTADNYESCIVWLQGLQAKRNRFSMHHSIERKSSVEHTTSTQPGFKYQLENPGSFSCPEVDPHKSTIDKDTSAKVRKQLERQQRIMRFFTQSTPSFPEQQPHKDAVEEHVSSKQRCLEMSMGATANPSLEDDVFEDFLPAHTSLQATRSNASERSGRLASNDSILDRDSDYSSHMSTAVADLEQQVITAKCDLAVMMNRETSFMTMLEQRDQIINELTAKLREIDKYAHSRKGNEKYAKEIIQKLKSENKFLNSEIRNLADSQYQDKLQAQDLLGKLQVLKRDYVYTLQSTVTIPTGDIMDGMSVKLYGGKVHQERVSSLLEEARDSNPSLPTCESILSSDTHIDEFGFIHDHKSKGMALHYAARQLVQHYNKGLASYEEHQLAWKDLLEDLEYNECLPKSKELKKLCRAGIPHQYRSEVWYKLVYAQVKDIIDDKGPHYYNHLVSCACDSKHVGTYRKQISLDLLRTMPDNVNYSTTEAEGTQQMREILEAFCMHNPDIGYCQGMNFIIAVCLLIMQPEEAFWTLIAITERFFGSNYFDINLTGAQADQEVLKDIVMEKLPDLYHHLINLDIEISTVTLNWFLAIFYDAVPFETLLRIWDCFLLEGPKVLFRFSVAVLKMNEPGLLVKKDTISIMKHLKCCAKLAFDSDALVEKAFEDLKPFPRRRDLSAKQVVYLNNLKEKMRKRIVYKRSLTEFDIELRSTKANPNPTFDCCIPCDDGVVWIVSGSQKQSFIYELDCSTTSLNSFANNEVDSRVMCGCCVNQRLVVLGTLSWHLHAYSVLTRTELWCLRLQESVMSMASCHTNGKTRLFCGLANGTIAILEQKQLREPADQPLYLPISHNAVTALLHVREDYMWAGCGPNIYVLHTGSLDTLEKFSVSSNHFDHISSLKSANNEEVWLSVKGSACIQLWNVDTLSCHLKYSVGDGKNIKEKRDSHTTINENRITSILPFDDCIWVANAQGYLFIYDVKDCISTSLNVSHAHSAHSTSGISTPIQGRLEEEALTEKLNQVYYERLFEDRNVNATKESESMEQEPTIQIKVSTETSDEKEKVSRRVPKKPKRKVQKQKAVDTSSPYLEPIRTINVETGSIELQEQRSTTSISDYMDTTKSRNKQPMVDAIEATHTNNLNGDNKINGHLAEEPYIAKEKAELIDVESIDTISLTSTSSLENQKDVISKVVHSRAAQRKLQRQLRTHLTRSLSSESSFEDSNHIRKLNGLKEHCCHPSISQEKGRSEELSKSVNKRRSSLQDHRGKQHLTSMKSIELFPLNHSKRRGDIIYAHTTASKPAKKIILRPRSEELSSPSKDFTDNNTTVSAKNCTESYTVNNEIRRSRTLEKDSFQIPNGDTRAKSLPSLIRGVIDTGIPLPPTESTALRSHVFPNKQNMCSAANYIMPDRDEKYTPQSNKLRFRAKSLPNISLTKKDVVNGDHRARMLFQSQLTSPQISSKLPSAIPEGTQITYDSVDEAILPPKNHLLSKPSINDQLIYEACTKAVESQCLTTIEECTEVSTNTSPASYARRTYGTFKEPCKSKEIKEDDTCAVSKQHKVTRKALSPLHSSDLPKVPNNTPEIQNKATQVFEWDSDCAPEGKKKDTAFQESNFESNVIRKLADLTTDESKTQTPRLYVRKVTTADQVQLSLQARIKIADQPVRCLAQTWLSDEHVIISCAGHEKDQEAVLRWTRLPNESLWTNVVISEAEVVIEEPELPPLRKLLRRISTSTSLKNFMN